jgi:SAM-dependent methyltransferase
MTSTGFKELPQKLNLGCGRRRIAGALNADINRDVEPDLEYDLDRLPWPLPTGYFIEVFAYDVIEHCANVLAVMEEIHRVTRDGALVRITVPIFHARTLSPIQRIGISLGFQASNYVTGDGDFPLYTKGRFRSRVRNLMFHPHLLNRLARRMANRWPERYERRWTWLFPAWFIYFELEVVKG